MIDLSSLLTIGAAFFVIAVAPGPATLGVVAVSLRAGRWAGLAFGCGLSLGLVAWGIVAATGLGAVLQASAIVLSVIKLLGGAYLLWLAWNAANAARQADAPLPKVTGRGLWFRQGVLLNLSNPKAVLAWMATLSLGMTDDQGAGHMVAALILCTGLGLLIYTGYALLFSTPRAVAIYAYARRGVEATIAILFAAAGLGLMKSALSR